MRPGFASSARSLFRLVSYRSPQPSMYLYLCVGAPPTFAPRPTRPTPPRQGRVEVRVGAMGGEIFPPCLVVPPSRGGRMRYGSPRLWVR